jgi:hypothetical protein
MKIYLKGYKEEIIPLLVEPFYSVRLVKQIIQEKIGILVKNQRLVCNNTELDDHRTLASYNIQKEATLHIVLRLRGD